MFRVQFYVDDRKLGDALRALAGLIQGSPEVMPVVNADVVGGKLTARTNGNSNTMFMEYIAKHKLKEVNCAVAQNFLKGLGRPVGSASYVLKQAQKIGGLKKKPGTKGTSTVYLVRS
jgi:hypothetical protein